MHISFLKNDKKFIIVALNGLKNYINNINECYKKKDEVVVEIKSLFINPNIKNFEKKHAQDKTGKSKTTTTLIELDSGGYIAIACYDWSAEMKFRDHLRVSILNNKYRHWINTEAY